MPKVEITPKITLPGKIGIYEGDDIFILVVFVLMGIYIKWWFLPVGPVLAHSYNRFRSKKGRGYTNHRLYGFGIISLLGYPLASQKRLTASIGCDDRERAVALRRLITEGTNG